jgi:hypothetical protein
MLGNGALYDELRDLLDCDYPATTAHAFFAGLPAALQAKGYAPRPQLLVTTNYDDLLERSFDAAGEAFDLVVYLAEGEHQGKFLHRPPGGEATVIERPNDYAGFVLDEDRNLPRAVILKIHGAIDRRDRDRDSFVITEDDYIDYLTRTELTSLVPAALVEKLKHSHFLFLGYSLRDWNLRVILQRIWGQQALSRKSWAVQVDPADLDRRFWADRNVEIIARDLRSYTALLRERLAALPERTPPPPP